MKQLLLIRSRDWTLGPILLSVLFLIGCSTPSRLPQTAPAAADLTAPINSSEAIIEQGGDPFSDYSLPQAIVKFKQGFGRLIRNKCDRGCVICLDNRIIKKQKTEK